MRKIGCFDIHGVSVQDVLDEFNERQEELGDQHGFSDGSDIISISTRSVDKPHKIGNPDGGSCDSKVIVTLFFWSNE